MAVEPLSMTTAIITLANTLERVINLMNDIQDAPRKIVEIKTDCNLTQGVLRSIRRQLRATEVVLPTLRIYGSEDEDAGVNLANLLRDNVDQLQLDLNSLLSELKRLDRSGNSESRIYGWISRGVLGFRMSYLTTMQRNIATKRGQLQLVQSSLRMEVESGVTLERRANQDDMAAMLVGISPRSREDRERLMRAVRRENRQEAESLLSDVRADPNFLDDRDGLSPLCLAAMQGDVAMIELLLQHGALVDWCSRDQSSPLMLALLYSHPVVALALIRRGADISHTDAHNSSALHYACHRNFYAVVQVLLRNGADPNLRDCNGRTPLREAVSRDDREIQPQDTSVLQILLEPRRGGVAADPILGTHDHRYNPAHHAARNGFLADLTVLTSPQYSIDSPACSTPDSEGHTPLWFGSYSGHVQIIRYLIDITPSDVNTPSRDPDNPTPLMALLFSKHASPSAIPEGASALLTANADPNARNSHGLTLLHRLASADKTPLITLLLAHGADPRLTDNEGKQPLHLAAAAGHEDAVSLLLESQSQTPTVDINAVDSESHTALMLAAASGHDYIVHLLISRGADWTLRDDQGCDAFYLACAWGHLLVASYLLGRGVDVNGVNVRGNTALHGAVRMGRGEVVRWLLRMGADAEVRSTEPFEGVDVVGTPVEVARGMGGVVGEEMARVIEGWDRGRRRLEGIEAMDKAATAGESGGGGDDGGRSRKRKRVERD
ncbi:ankyrin repeat-containing domain protein [Cercophora newfieldiana]|uniref:Ankyrin repeat-containing domain protein n=1 Tax=Cercophora newfieldiana TaxID=92897 RepID=A0AA40CT69_9PEZI|nr:ankyrin repeat-containing domain protein [Cercophora newfieldiana]